MVMPDSARLSPVTGGSIVGLQRDAVRVEDQNPYELDIRRLVRSRSGRCGFGRRWFVGDPDKMTDLPDHAPHGSDVRQPGYATDLVQLKPISVCLWSRRRRIGLPICSISMYPIESSRGPRLHTVMQKAARGRGKAALQIQPRVIRLL
jgi:hypothetical protein